MPFLPPQCSKSGRDISRPGVHSFTSLNHFSNPMENSLSDSGESLTRNPDLGILTRRGFIAASAATLASCKAASSVSPPSQTAAVKPPSNKDYRTPSVQGPVPRNNAGNHSSNFSKDAGVTFSRVQVSGNFIAITFDDGPHPQNTPRLLDMLAKRNIKATFYVIGRSVDLHPGVLRRTVAEGHEIGNHSHTHRLLSKLGNDEVRQEMKRCQDAVGRAAGVRPRTMRPPYGGLLQSQRELVHEEFGYPTILWPVDPLDWKRPWPFRGCLPHSLRDDCGRNRPRARSPFTDCRRHAGHPRRAAETWLQVRDCLPVDRDENGCLRTGLRDRRPVSFTKLPAAFREPGPLRRAILRHP